MSKQKKNIKTDLEDESSVASAFQRAWLVRNVLVYRTWTSMHGHGAACLPFLPSKYASFWHRRRTCLLVRTPAKTGHRR